MQGDYFQAMGIPLLSGRFFTNADAANKQLVVIVNRKLAEHYWPGSDPVGKRLHIGTPSMQVPWMTVVGEVADVKEYSPDEPDKEQYYQPIDQMEESLGSLGSTSDSPRGNGGYIAIRTAMEPEQMANALRTTVRAIDPQLALEVILLQRRLRQRQGFLGDDIGTSRSIAKHVDHIIRPILELLTAGADRVD